MLQEDPGPNPLHRQPLRRRLLPTWTGRAWHSSKSLLWDSAVPHGCCRARLYKMQPSRRHFYPSVPFKLSKVREEERTRSRERRWEGWSQGSVRPGFHREQTRVTQLSLSIFLRNCSQCGLRGQIQPLCSRACLLGTGSAETQVQRPGARRQASESRNPSAEAQGQDAIISKERTKEGASETHLWLATGKVTTCKGSVHNSRRIHCLQPL